MNSHIVPLSESHFEAVRSALDEVAREKRYLALTQAPPPAEMFAFLRGDSHAMALLRTEDA